MKRFDQIKLNFTRNWDFPGKERLSRFLRPSDDFKNGIKNGIVWLNKEDIAIYADADSYIEWSIMAGGTYEDEINKLIRISLKQGDNCLDVGGNIGLQSIRMSQSVGAAGTVFTFEPMAHLQQKLKDNLALNKVDNVKLFPFALADAESTLEYYIDKKTWNQGTFSLAGSEGPDKQLVSIKVADNIPEISALTQLSLIKIDVEGYEYQVLKGLTKSIERLQPRIIFEYDSHYWKKTSQDISECFRFLVKLSYNVYQITAVGCKLIVDVKSVSSGNLFCMPITRND